MSRVEEEVTYLLNANRAKREKLEALFQAIYGDGKTIRMATASWPLVITGQASVKLALETQTKHYLDSPADIDRCTLLVALYFRELEALSSSGDEYDVYSFYEGNIGDTNFSGYVTNKGVRLTVDQKVPPPPPNQP